MLKILGTSALSEHRLNQLLKQVQQIDSNISEISARFVHFVEAEKDLSTEEMAMLGRLLTYGYANPAKEVQGHKFLVVPRPGTISPWSSKATEITERCGLTSVLRLERGIEYVVAGDLNAAAKQSIELLIHDRMTQSVLKMNKA